MKRTIFLSVFILPLLLFSFSSESAKKKEIIVLDSVSTSIPRAEREALLILPGFGAKLEGIKDIGAYFAHKGYDLYIPNYIGNDSIEQCVANLDRFYKDNHLSEYKKVHIFSFIIGSWVLNRWILDHPVNNIATIVYDRSPLQERAPYALATDMPFLIGLVPNGDVIKEFARTPYSSIPNDEKNIGIIMESTASKLIRKHKKTALSLGEVKWDIADRKQDCDDFFYTMNNHDDMYHDFSVTGKEILFFIKNGKFSDEAARTRPDVDPFKH